jgi:hypothetical protein
VQLVLIRLSLAPGEAEVQPREWQYDPHNEMLLHVPTRSLFHLYPERRAIRSRRVTSRIGEADMRARLVYVSDGFSIPSPEEITALGRAAIRWLVSFNELE